MRHFTSSGLWFLGDDPKNRVAGTLRYSEHGLYLKLLGGFRGGWRPKVESYPLIHGIVSKNHYGEFVTLSDCFTKQTNLSSAGIGSETIYCNRGIVGDAHLLTDYDQFEALDFTTSYLSDWFGRRGIASQLVPMAEELGFDIRYRKPEPVRFQIGDLILILGVAAQTSEASYTLNITEEAHLFIKPLPRLTAELLHSEYVRPLQNLLSFATDTPNAVEQIELRGAKVAPGEVEKNRKYYLLYNPIFRSRRRKDRLTPDDMLFTFDEAQEAGLNIFEKWIDFTRRHEAFCTVYFGWLYAPPRYLDEKFLRLMSAFKLLTTSLGEVSQRTALFSEEIYTLSAGRFTEEERALLRHIMPTGPEIEMPFRMLILLEEHRSLMSQIIRDDLSGFVRSVCDTLAFIERRTATTGSPPRQDEDLHSAVESMRMLIRMVVLKELGFDEDQVSKFIERNENFVHMRGL